VDRKLVAVVVVLVPLVKMSPLVVRALTVNLVMVVLVLP
jgi:hypothetical protein